TRHKRATCCALHSRRRSTHPFPKHGASARSACEECVMMLALMLAAAAPQKLPPANPMPLEAPGTSAVMAPINAMFAGITARDGQAILSQVRSEGGATAVSEKPDGSRSISRRSWAEFAGGIKPGAER